MAAASVFEFPNYYPYTPSDTDVLSVIPYLVTHRLNAYNDETGSNVSMTLGATSNIIVEAQSNVDVFVGSNVGAFRLYQTSFCNNERTDQQIVQISNSNNSTVFKSVSSLNFKTDDPQQTATLTTTTFSAYDGSQHINTSASNGFIFDKTVQVSGNTFTSGNNITLGNVYGNNLNVWTDKQNASYDRVGYGFRINNSDQLELVKYTRLVDGNTSVTKKVAVFGTTTGLSFSSDTQYLVFDALTGVSVAGSSNTGSFNTGTSSGVTGSNVSYPGLTMQGSNLTFTNSSNLTDGKLNVGFTSVDDLPYKVSVNGEIYAQSDIIAFSDRRVKSDLEVIPDALNKVLSINGYTFKRSDMPEKNRRYAGVIAQEVLSVLPEVIHETNDGFYHVAYGNMVSILIEAVKELNAKIERLTA